MNSKKSIVLSLQILIISALAFAALPATSYAKVNAYVNGYQEPSRVEREDERVVEQAPVITAITPGEAQINSGAKTITIEGSGFVPGSVAKVNGANRYTTFIDNSHLLAQATSYDVSQTSGGFYVSVINPNGDYSNAAFFKLEGIAAAPVSNTNNNANDYYNYPGSLEAIPPTPNEDTSLASSVILGGNTFLPSSIVQWVLLAIIIMFIIILVRRIFGAREQYDNTPLKHA